MSETELVVTFLPQPRKTVQSRGYFSFFPGRLILLQGAHPQKLMYTAQRIQQALPNASRLRWDLTAGWSVPQTQVGLALRVDANAVQQPQGYHLLVSPDGIQITGHDEAGVYYGACTLIQALHQVEKNRLPCFEVFDWPDFPVRGVMLDISRDKVPQMSTLYELVDRLAGWKINQLQLYTEHTFSYRNHPEVWAHASPMTGSEIMALDAYCRENYIELAPNQNSFGHLQPWLKHPKYAALAEVQGEFSMPWGPIQGPFSLAPLHPGSLELVRSMYDELLPHFSSRLFNVGCDETHDLGQGQTREACQKLGIGRVYLDFFLKIYSEVSRRGYTMQYWGDIILKHPELVPEIPRDAIGLLWGYEANHPFAREAELFCNARLPFYVCPGTSSWTSLERVEIWGGRLSEHRLGRPRPLAGAAGQLCRICGRFSLFVVPGNQPEPGPGPGAQFARL
jgi:hexosaminidase